MYTLKELSMPAKIRKQIYIEPEQEVLLKLLVQETGSTEAAIVRQALAQYTQSLQMPQRDLRAWEQERLFIQNAIAQGAIPGHRTWQRQDLYE